MILNRVIKMISLLIGCLFVVTAVLQVARAQQFVWSTWEARAVPHLGPAATAGVLIYLHGRGDIDVANGAIPGIFVEMARSAEWDILRINRLPYVDVVSEDDRQVSFLADEAARARRSGYRRIIVAGASRGGWLALSASRLVDVDGVIGLAPGTLGRSPDELRWQRDELARRLSDVKASRIAAFFFEGDSLEDLPGGRADAMRSALRNTSAAYMLVDKPPDLSGHSAAGSGLFTRRYRDCLVAFMSAADIRSGPTNCRTTGGYASGSDIVFPVRQVDSTSVDRGRFASYAGRWEGDDSSGAYVILQSVEATADRITFLFGQSLPPDWHRPPLVKECAFAADADGETISCALFADFMVLTVRKLTADEIELRASYPSTKNSPGRMILHRRAP